MNRRRVILICAGLALVTLLVVLTWEFSARGVRGYGYVFYESTGQNQYILICFIEMPFRFDEDRSNKLALNTLRSLSPRVLYANSKGGKICLVGEYDRRSQSFALYHWYIRVPFIELTLIDGIQDPETIKEVTRYSLERTDFEPSLPDFDPASPDFNPTMFEKR